ncbi:MAG TPA: MFS transporter [Chloroflexota bacterium]|nr:MFS transporter [Chloroflexota bacterium]
MDSPRADRPWATFSLASVAQLMIILDVSIINVALPSIQRGLHYSREDLQWVVNIYVLLFGGFLLLGGRAGDLWGRRRLFMIGMALFTGASLFGGLAQNGGWLVAARAAQGLGGAIISPVAFAIVTSLFPEGAQRNKAVGIYGALAGFGGALGVLLGGILTSSFGWQWVLFVNVPIGIVAIVLSPIFIPESHGAGGRESFDLLGALSVTAGLVALVYGVVKAPDKGWTSGTTIGSFILAAVLLAAFLVIETHSPTPLVRLGIFRIRSLAVANGLGFLAGLVIFGMFFFLSLYLQIVLGYSPLKTGFSYLPLALMIIFTAGLASVIVTRIGFKLILAFGMLLSTLGLFLFTRIPVSGNYATDILPGMLLVAAGLGFVFVPLSIAAVAGVTPSEVGLASGLINASQQVGGAIGLAILSTISTQRFNTLIKTTRGPEAYFSSLVGGYHYAFGSSTVVLAVGIVLTLGLLPGGGQGSGQSAAAVSAA